MFGTQLSNVEMKHGILSHIETFYDNKYKLVPRYVFHGGWAWVGRGGGGRKYTRASVLSVRGRNAHSFR
jgi:hypothetical protein